MPVLSAAGYPTLQFPTKEPSPTAGTPFQNIPVDASMFGGRIGAALQEAGTDFERASAHWENIQNLHNQVVVDDQTNQAEDRINKRLYGDPAVQGDTGFYGLRGDAAIREFPNVRRDIDAIIQEHRGNMQNTPQQLRFDEATRHFQNNTLQVIGRHYDNEYKTYEAEAAKGRMVLNHGNIATSAAQGDWDSFINFTNQDQDYIEQHGKSTGMSRDAIDAMKQERRKQAAKEWTQSLGAKDSVAADRFIENNKDALGDLYPDLKKENRARALRQFGEDQFLNKPFNPDMHRVIGGKPGGPLGAGAQPIANDVIGELKGRGWSDAAIVGILNNVMQESSFNPNAGGRSGEVGLFQLHPGSHLPVYQNKYGTDLSPKSQAKYVADWVEAHMPDYKNVADSATATQQFFSGFEAPGDQSPDALMQRTDHTATSSSMLQKYGQPQAQAVSAPIPGVIDKTTEAGFGARYGQLEGVKGVVVHHTAARGSVDGVIHTFQERGFPAHYVIARDGSVYQTLPDGVQGQHTQNAYPGTAGEGLGNSNTIGIEVIANNDADVTPAQKAAGVRLVTSLSEHYGFSLQNVYGHGEVNPGHKQASEGMTIVKAVRSGEAPRPPLATRASVPFGGTPPAGALPKKPPGLIEKGNIDLNTHPVMTDEKGEVIGDAAPYRDPETNKIVLLPTVALDGSAGTLSIDEAIAQYKKTGKHLGQFNSVANASAYADQIQDAQQEQQYQYGRPSTGDPLISEPRGLGNQAAGIYQGPAARAPGTDIMLPSPGQGGGPVYPDMPKVLRDKVTRENQQIRPFFTPIADKTVLPPGAQVGPVDQYIPPPRDEGSYQDNEVPGLEQKLREYDKRAVEQHWTQEQYVSAYDYARKRMNQAYADAQHKRVADRAAVADADTKLTQEYYKRMGPDSKNYPTTAEVRADVGAGRFSPEAGRHMIQDITTASKPEPTKRDSDLAHSKLDERIWLPDGDPSQLNTENAIRKEYWDNRITKEARDDLLTELAKKQDSQNAVLNNRARNLIESVERKIRPWKVMGDLAEASKDPEGVERLRRFKDNLYQQVHNYRNPPPGQSAKNPADLFDSTKPDFLGAPDKLKDFLPAGGDPLKTLNDKPKAGAKGAAIDLNTLGTNPDKQKAIAEIQAALDAKQINPGQARAIAVQRGLAVSAQPRPDLTPLARPSAPAAPSAP